jgi:hypothetical protein
METEVTFNGDTRRSKFENGVEGYTTIWYDDQMDEINLAVGYAAPNDIQSAWVALTEAEVEWMIYKLTLVHEQAQSARQDKELLETEEIQ